MKKGYSEYIYHDTFGYMKLIEYLETLIWCYFNHANTAAAAVKLDGRKFWKTQEISTTNLFKPWIIDRVIRILPLNKISNLKNHKTFVIISLNVFSDG